MTVQKGIQTILQTCSNGDIARATVMFTAVPLGRTRRWEGCVAGDDHSRALIGHGKTCRPRRSDTHSVRIKNWISWKPLPFQPPFKEAQRYFWVLDWRG